MQAGVREIYVDSAISDYIVRLVNATRSAPGRVPRGVAARLARAVPRGAGVRGASRVATSSSPTTSSCSPSPHWPTGSSCAPRRPSGTSTRPLSCASSSTPCPSRAASLPPGSVAPLSPGMPMAHRRERTHPDPGWAAPDPLSASSRIAEPGMRGPRLVVGSLVLATIAFSTGIAALTFLPGCLVPRCSAGAWLLTRWSLRGLEAGYALDRRAAPVGETLTIAYTVRDPGRLPRLWLDVHSPTDAAHPPAWPRREPATPPAAQLDRRDHAHASRAPPHRARRHPHRRPAGPVRGVRDRGQRATSIVVTPRVEPLPLFRLPPALVQGGAARPERTAHTTPLVTGVRPYLPGDAYNRIHWRTSARVTASSRSRSSTPSAPPTSGCTSTSTGRSTLDTVTARRSRRRSGWPRPSAAGPSPRAVRWASPRRARGVSIIPPDRGPRQLQRLLHLLAGASADASASLVELLLLTLPQVRRGMTVVVVTPSLDPSWVGPLLGLRGRGVGTLACIVDPVAHEDQARALGLELGRPGWSRPGHTGAPPLARRTRHPVLPRRPGAQPR